MVLFRETDVTGITFFWTETLQVAVLFPALADIVAAPSLTAVIMPFLSTVATDADDDDHVTDLSSASFGYTVALNLVVCPSSREMDVLSNTIDVTGVVTETEPVADLSPTLATRTAPTTVLAFVPTSAISRIL